MRCNRSSAGRSRGPANFRYWAGSQGIERLSVLFHGDCFVAEFILGLAEGQTRGLLAMTSAVAVIASEAKQSRAQFVGCLRRVEGGKAGPGAPAMRLDPGAL